MKINYDEIITKANERKDRLQVVVHKLASFDIHKNALLEELGYFMDLSTYLAALDLEGKLLLGKGTEQLCARIQAVGYACQQFNRSLTNPATPNNHNYMNIDDLSEMLDD